MLRLKKGIQLESLGQPFKQALATAARVGAEGVEINARSQLRPAEMSRTGVRHLKKMLADLNLKVCAVHFPTRGGYAETNGLEQRIEATRSAMSMAYDLGCNVVRNRIGDIPQDEESDQWQTLVQALTDLGNHAHKSGAWLAAQTGREAGSVLKKLIDVLPPASLGVDFDAAELLINGFSPEETMRQLGESVVSFRARDAVRDLALGRGLEVQLGRGSVDMAALLGTLEEHRYDGYIVVERNSTSDPVQQCSDAIEYLTNMFV